MKTNKITIPILVFIFLTACRKDNIEPKLLPDSYRLIEGSIGAADKSTIFSSDNNIIICGQNDNSIFIHKSSPSGMEFWRKEFFIGNSSFACAITENPAGELIFLGQSSSFVTLKKIDSEGNVMWSKNFQDSSFAQHGIYYSINKDVITLPNGDIIFNTGSGKPYLTDGSILVKVNSIGDTLWTKYLYQGITQLTHTNTGEIIATGYTGDPLNGFKLKIVKLNLDGTEIWSSSPYLTQFTLSTFIKSVVETSEGEYIMVGDYFWNRSIDNQGGFGMIDINSGLFFVVKIDNLGNLVFAKTFGSTGYANSIKANSDGTYTAIGAIDGESGILKFDQNGKQIWWKKIQGESPINLQKTDNSGNVITGSNFGAIFHVHTDSVGIVD
jgi:hypothetical protein